VCRFAADAGERPALLAREGLATTAPGDERDQIRGLDWLGEDDGGEEIGVAGGEGFDRIPDDAIGVTDAPYRSSAETNSLSLAAPSRRRTRRPASDVSAPSTNSESACIERLPHELSSGRTTLPHIRAVRGSARGADCYHSPRALPRTALMSPRSRYWMTPGFDRRPSGLTTVTTSPREIGRAGVSLIFESACAARDGSAPRRC
jgi:hypothetical protein